MAAMSRTSVTPLMLSEGPVCLASPFRAVTASDWEQSSAERSMNGSCGPRSVAHSFNLWLGHLWSFLPPKPPRTTAVCAHDRTR
jgi:hypothetical protein